MNRQTRVNKVGIRNSFVVLGIVALTSFAQLVWATEYEIDSGHSNVGFTAKHLVSKVNGEFTDFSGTFSFDPAKPEASKVSAEVKSASIFTKDKKRDQHLQSDDFFSAKKFPKITFVSTEIKGDGDKKYKMTGDLTLKGVTKPVTFDVEYLGEMKGPYGDQRAGFSALGKINRKDFGMNWNKVLDSGGLVIGDEVAIQLNVEAAAKQAEAAEEKSVEKAKPAKKEKKH